MPSAASLTLPRPMKYLSALRSTPSSIDSMRTPESSMPCLSVRAGPCGRAPSADLPSSHSSGEVDASLSGALGARRRGPGQHSTHAEALPGVEPSPPRPDTARTTMTTIVRARSGKSLRSVPTGSGRTGCSRAGGSSRADRHCPAWRRGPGSGRGRGARASRGRSGASLNADAGAARLGHTRALVRRAIFPQKCWLSLSLSLLLLGGCVGGGEPDGPALGDVSSRVEALAAGPPIAPEPAPDIEWPPPGPVPPSPAELFAEPARPGPAAILAAFLATAPDAVVVASAVTGSTALADGHRIATFALAETLVGSSPPRTFDVRADDPVDQFCTCVRLAPVPGHRYLLVLHDPGGDPVLRLASVPRVALGWAPEGADGRFYFSEGTSVSVSDVRTTFSGGT